MRQRPARDSHGIAGIVHHVGSELQVRIVDGADHQHIGVRDNFIAASSDLGRQVGADHVFEAFHMPGVVVGKVGGVIERVDDRTQIPQAATKTRGLQIPLDQLRGIARHFLPAGESALHVVLALGAQVDLHNRAGDDDAQRHRDHDLDQADTALAPDSWQTSYN